MKKDVKLIATYLFGQLTSLAAVGVALFWSAGRLDWWQAWAVLAVWLVWFMVIDIIILQSNPDLMRERMSPPKEGKAWDRLILTIMRLVQLARYILAGFDLRFGWTQGFPIAAEIAALLLCLVATGLFFWAMAVNPFFSQVVRIQTERGHTVAMSGPYRWIRHPGYTGMILFDLALSTALGSWWAIGLGAVCALLLIVRTALEDRTLQAELPGYGEYAARVRWRLLPWIW